MTTTMNINLLIECKTSDLQTAKTLTLHYLKYTSDMVPQYLVVWGGTNNSNLERILIHPKAFKLNCLVSSDILLSRYITVNLYSLPFHLWGNYMDKMFLLKLSFFVQKKALRSILQATPKSHCTDFFYR